MADWFYIGYCVAIAECFAILAWIVKPAYHALRKLPLSHLLALSLLAFGTSLDAQKTNLLLRVIGGFMWQGMIGATVEERDITRGWLIEGVVTNATISYAMPTNATLVGNWHIHGARSSFGNNVVDFGVLRTSGTLDPTNWAFPLGTNDEAFSSFWYFIDGRIRPTPRDAAHEICAVGVPMSAVPGQSRLWRLDGGDGSRVLTWENFFLGGDTNAPVNAQIVLCPNGDFVTRSNEVETVCRRVNPDDWDDDGIPNDEDANPTVCDGDFFGPANVLPEGANTNAYCTVSLVATGPDALVAFAGDKPGNYPDPRFVAKSGVTNEVVILIGKTYAISSDWPFAVVGVSDPDTEVWQMRGATHQTYVCRPVTISASDGNPFTMSVVPLNLGGVFLWPSAQCGCSISGSGNTFTWNCPMDCTCCGCAVEGRYSYEGYWLPATSCLCGCHYDGTGPTWEPSSAPLAASVSASFSKSAVIFEDAYENLPGQWVGKNSTRTRLNIVANGGPNGGTLSVTSANIGKLSRISGPDLPLASVAVPAETQVSYAIVYEGGEASATTNDICVIATFAENTTGAETSCTGEVTSVEVELATLNLAPANTNLHRHVFGILEEVHYCAYPESVATDWSFFEGEEEHMPFSPGRMILPAMTNQYTNGLCEYRVMVNDVCYTNQYLCVMPIIAARNPRCNEDIQPVFGDAGWLLLHIALYVEPAFVSFKGLQMREIPDESGNCPHDGYYNDTTKGGPLSHSAAVGAGVVNEVRADGYWTTDMCGVATGYETPWSDGWKEWPIPIGWGYGNSIMGQYASPPTTQRFTLRANGTFSIKKFGIEATRDIQNNITIHGAQ